MCALIRDLTVPIEDLRRLSIECCACHTVMTLDLAGKMQTTVSFCPACRREFQPAIKDRVRALADLLDALSDSKECAFAFRVAPPPEVAS
jgi:PHP family Zn ribbon phosphoesterase